MILGLSGYAQAGKDTIGGYLVEEHGFVRFSFADALKELALETDPSTSMYHTRPLSKVVQDFGWEAAKRDPDVRRFLQNLGVAMRNRDPDYWVNIVRERIALIDGGDIVLTDVRFDNEAAVCNRHALVIRPGIGPANDHASEQMASRDLRDFDHIVHNDGTEEQCALLATKLCAAVTTRITSGPPRHIRLNGARPDLPGV